MTGDHILICNSRWIACYDKVRHELVMLPYLGVFDNLAFSIDGSDDVVLTGQVVRPILKSEAEAAVHLVQGITKVVDNIEVLLLSPCDDAIRLRTYRAIYSRPGFEKSLQQLEGPRSFSLTIPM
jgi:hyperosmotically inducible protein